MTSLICLIQRCNLRDGRLIRENEPFTCGEEEAAILIRGGIAKEVENPAEIPAPVEKQEKVRATIVEKQSEPGVNYGTVQTKTEEVTFPPEETIPEPQPAEKIYAKRKGKR